MSSIELNGEGRDPAASVAWSNPTAGTLGTDEALGGALLTPIPWLTRRSPEGNSDTPTSSSAGAQIHSESTETIEGPNGMGRIETVSVSINGIPSTGHTRGVTQGELLRQEQRAGVVPVSQLNRSQESPGEDDREMDEEEEEVPHARGPEEIGVGDTGPQGVTTSYMGEDGVNMQGIDVEAAVGRKHEDDEHTQPQDGPKPKDDDASSTSSTESTGTKREAEQELEGEPAKKVKEDDEASPDVAVEDAPPAEAASSKDDVPTATEEAPASTEAKKDDKEEDAKEDVSSEAKDGSA